MLGGEKRGGEIGRGEDRTGEERTSGRLFVLDQFNLGELTLEICPFPSKCLVLGVDLQRKRVSKKKHNQHELLNK